MAEMSVNFNNLRKQAVYSYDRLVDKLNNSISEDDWGRKVVQIDPEDIQEDMDDLRRLILSIAMVYDENNPDFKDVTEGMNIENVKFFNYNEEGE